MNSQPIASDLSYECLQLRRLRGELGAQSFDSTNRPLNRVSGYRQFIADPDMDPGDSASPVPLVRAVGEPE
jgi:hypothetical protein